MLDREKGNDRKQIFRLFFAWHLWCYQFFLFLSSKRKTEETKLHNRMKTDFDKERKLKKKVIRFNHCSYWHISQDNWIKMARKRYIVLRKKNRINYLKYSHCRCRSNLTQIITLEEIAEQDWFSLQTYIDHTSLSLSWSSFSFFSLSLFFSLSAFFFLHHTNMSVVDASVLALVQDML